MEKYQISHTVAWADVDANGHVRHSAYLDYAVECRMAFFRERGFPMGAWAKVGGAPILLEQQVVYKRELRLEESITVTLEVEKISDDKRFFHIKHQVFKVDGTLSADIKVVVAYMNLATRKLDTAPEILLEVMNR